GRALRGLQHDAEAGRDRSAAARDRQYGQTARVLRAGRQRRDAGAARSGRPAPALLIPQPAPVAEIGYLVGCESPSQFSREYSRTFGTPPGKTPHGEEFLSTVDTTPAGLWLLVRPLR